MTALRVLKHIAIASCMLVVEAAFLGNIIRVRAQYAPKEENPDAEDNKEVMGVSFVRMLKRVCRVEGWQGLLRGIVVLVTLALAFAALFWAIGGHQFINDIDPVLRTIICYVLAVLINIPVAIFFIRSNTVAELLPFFDLSRGLGALLSPAECRRPWLLYFTPGLFLVIALDQAWELIAVPNLIKLISRHLDSGARIQAIIPDHHAIIFAKLGLVVVDTLLLTPLKVATVRLAIQRNEEQPILLPESDDIPVSERVAEGEEVVATGKVPVVRLRTQTEQPAYTGLFNCIASITAEEGCDTLYRVWWFTFLTGVVRVMFERKFRMGH